jgi:glutaredoxin
LAELVLYTAAGCHLCDRARAALAELRAELAFEVREVDITGDPVLEARYRELLPVVELAGRRICTYFVKPAAVRRAFTG